MKIQLKRSNQLDGGAAKQPTAAQMEYGELAVNYNDTDPAIFIKDSDDNIIRIAGVGSISSGDVPSGGSGDKPDAPSLGDLYFDTDLNILLYWNGNEWIEISPTLVADGSTAALPDATEHGEGTLWWDSDAASGKLFICYDDPGQGKVWVEASPMPNGGTLPDLSDPDNQGGTLDTRYVRADVTDHKQGNLTIGDGPGNNNIRLNEDGSAVFADGIANIYNNGTIRTGDNPGTNGNFGADLNNNGQVRIRTAETEALRIFPNTGTDESIVLSSDGSASFDKNVTVGDFDDTANGVAGVYLDYQGGVASQRPSTQGTSSIFTGKLGPATTFNVFADGSAEFAGVVQAKNATNGTRTEISPQGQVYVVTNVGGSSDIVWQHKYGSSTPSTIKADGSAEFAGDVVVGEDPNVIGSPSGIILRERGQVIVSRPTTNPLWTGYQTGALDYSSLIRANGSAEFAGDLVVSSVNSVASTTDGGTYLGNFGQVVVNAASDTPEDSRVFLGKNKNVTTSEINADGSATFEGTVDVNDRFRVYEATISPGNSLFEAQSDIGGTRQTKIQFLTDGRAKFDGVVTTDDRFVCNAGGKKKASEVAFLMYQEDAASTAVSITAAGSAEFASNVTSGIFDTSKNDVAGARLQPGLVKIQRPTSIVETAYSFETYYGTTPKIQFTNAGNAEFAGNVGVDGSLFCRDTFKVFDGDDVNPTTTIYKNGSATFDGTVTANGTILTRAGGTTLDVGDRLEKADAALQTLKTAAAAAADFAELKAAIATALADI